MEIQINHSIKLNDGIIINNALITVESANDNYQQKKVRIMVKLENEGVSLGRDIGLMSYTTTWSDTDVENFINNWALENKVD